MIAIIISITVMLSLLLSAFVGFNPNFKSLVERDFRRKAMENAANYSLKKGQLIARANPRSFNLPTPVSYNLDLRSDGVGSDSDSADYTLKDRAKVTISLAGQNLDIDVEHEYAPFP